MDTFLSDLGFSKFDIALLVLCPLGALLGSYAHVLMLSVNLDRMPREGSMKIVAPIDALSRFAWTWLRLSLGMILGLVIGLYFVGSLQTNVSTLAKVVALSILAGYAAPKLWIAQQKVMIEASLQRLTQMLNERSLQPLRQGHPAAEGASESAQSSAGGA